MSQEIKKLTILIGNEPRTITVMQDKAGHQQPPERSRDYFQSNACLYGDTYKGKTMAIQGCSLDV